MIFDRIENLKNYGALSEKVLEFLTNLDENTPCGRRTIESKTYANVEEYNTKSHENCFFEAHKKYIDIQILLKGRERLDFRNINGLSVKNEYDPEKDIVFYSDKETEGSIFLQNGNFAMLFPQDAHRPQMNASPEVCESVKKVVVKIAID